MASPSSSPQRGPPLAPATKATAAPATVDMETVELKDMIAAGPPDELPLKDDIMKLAMHGDEIGIRALIETGKVTADFRDEQGVSPLHWAAINNRYAVVKLLLDEGADPNAHGGESDATPAMWAAQRGHCYIVHLLLQRGADAAMMDGSGYNLLHLATFEGSSLLLVMLLHQGIPVDARDRQQHTSLMWAAYKGNPSDVDLFLRWGADIHSVDETGFTALHWALVRGNYACIQKLVEYGADRFAENSEGKSPATVASELKTERQWRDALEECGYLPNGSPKYAQNTILGITVQDKDTWLKRFFFLWPFVIVWAAMQCLCLLPWLWGILSALAVSGVLHLLATRATSYAEPGLKAIHKTPYLAGIFAGTAFWVALTWAARILPNTFWAAPISNMLFFALFGSCLWFYALCMIYNPGHVPKLTGLTEQKEVIEELIKDWKYDSENFCVHCMIRMPLRSKHCFRCKRCIAKHDHHCPWVFNCVGIANHRQFFLYILTLEFGLFALVRLLLVHFTILPPLTPPPTCSFLSEPLCSPLHQDPFTLFIGLWAVLQATWVTMLLAVQFLQIAKAQTTYESMHSSRHGRHADSHKLATSLTAAVTTGSTSVTGGGLDASARGPDPAADPSSVSPAPYDERRTDGWWKWMKRLLGVDVFVNTTARRNRNRRERNPFSVGVVKNWSDFWKQPGSVWRPARDGGMGTEGVFNGGVVNWAGVYDTTGLRMSRHGMV